MADVPKPISIFMCERVLRDVLRPDAITLVNIHSTMSVQAFPAIVPLVFAYAEVTGSNQEFTYQFKFVDNKNEVMAVSNVQKVAASPNKHLSHKLIGAFQGLVFPDQGNFNLLLALDGKDVAAMDFQVLMVTQETVA
ncbi:MAG: hypothetical protein K2X27_28385 [Candidatus Obscuribacterales bacterium]|nr:hypothetical protein [Candidatus Obscuribacterales bacterium]